MNSQEEWSAESSLTIADKGDQSGSDGDLPKCAFPPELLESLLEARRRRRVGLTIVSQLSARLLDREHGYSSQQKSRRACHHESNTPAIFVGNYPSQNESQHGAYRNSKGIKRQSGSSFLWRCDVGNHRVSARVTSGFSKSNAQPRQPHHTETRRSTTQQSERTPQRHRDGHNEGPTVPLSEASDGDTKKRVEDGKRQSCQHPKLQVADAQIFLDRFGQDGHDLTIEKTQRVSPQ